MEQGSRRSARFFKRSTVVAIQNRAGSKGNGGPVYIFVANAVSLLKIDRLIGGRELPLLGQRESFPNRRSFRHNFEDKVDGAAFAWKLCRPIRSFVLGVGNIEILLHGYGQLKE